MPRWANVGVIVGLVMALGAAPFAVEPPKPIHDEDEVKAKVELLRVMHVIVRVDLRPPDSSVTGYVGGAGRIRFDVVDDMGTRVRQVHYKDVLALVDARTNEAFAIVTPTWASQHPHRVSVILFGIAVGVVVILLWGSIPRT